MRALTVFAAIVTIAPIAVNAPPAIAVIQRWMAYAKIATAVMIAASASPVPVQDVAQGWSIFAQTATGATVAANARFATIAGSALTIYAAIAINAPIVAPGMIPLRRNYSGTGIFASIAHPNWSINTIHPSALFPLNWKLRPLIPLAN
jgi:hypothetical protein